MPYATLQDVRDVLAREADETAGTAASLEDPQIAEAIASAEQEVESRLSERYQVPFTEPVPAVVADITRDIAAYNADLVYRQSKDFSSENDPVLRRYKRASQLLVDIAAGKAGIPTLDGGSGAVQTARARGVTSPPGRFFSLDDFGLRRSWGGRSGRRVVTRHEYPGY